MGLLSREVHVTRPPEARRESSCPLLSALSPVGTVTAMS